MLTTPSQAAVARSLLPLRDPREHVVEHLAHADDRVLGLAADGERGVDERAVRGDPSPHRAEVAEHDLLLGRLAEDAHVGDPAVGGQVAAAGRVAAVLGAAELLAPLGLLDLARHTGDQHVALERDAGVLDGANRLEVAGQRALHVADAEAVDAPVLDHAPRAGSRRCGAGAARARSRTCPCGR